MSNVPATTPTQSYHGGYDTVHRESEMIDSSEIAANQQGQGFSPRVVSSVVTTVVAGVSLRQNEAYLLAVL